MYIFARGHLDIRAVSALTLQFHIAIPHCNSTLQFLGKRNEAST